MNKLRLIVLAGWILMFGAGFAFGRFLTQEQNSSESTYLDRLATQYDLSPEQVEDIGGYLETERATIDQILAGVEASVREQILGAREETVRKIHERLDGAQQERFDREREAGN
ncbi:MAG: hypothetical protein V2A76_00175 [Planctomycetota bacterium]